jgi:predicted nucleic acid-binding protein
MATILLDTDVFSYITSTNPARGAWYKPHLMGHILALSFITVGEQYAGYYKKINRSEWGQSHLDKLEERLRARLIIPYDNEISRTYGRLKASLRNADGSDRNIAPNDLWIAACAVRHGLRLATNNGKHLQNIPGLEIICESSKNKSVAEGGGVEPLPRLGAVEHKSTPGTSQVHPPGSEERT